MDRGGRPLFSPAAGPLLSLLRAPEKGLRQMAEAAESKLRADGGGERQDETALLEAV